MARQHLERLQEVDNMPQALSGIVLGVFLAISPMRAGPEQSTQIPDRHIMMSPMALQGCIPKTCSDLSTTVKGAGEGYSGKFCWANCLYCGQVIG